MKKLWKGLSFVISISIVSMILNAYLLGFIETLTIGIILGIIITNTIGYSKELDAGITYSLKKILKWGIILLGVNLNFSAVIQLGPMILILVITIVTSSLLLANLIGRYFGLNKKLSTLLGVGSSICGASAIVAMGPVIDSDEEDIAISVAIISLLGAIGVFVYSSLSFVLPLSDLEYGIWAGSSLQGVAHALAGAGARGADSISIEIGTIVKMARVTLLAPVAIILGIVFNNSKSGDRKKVSFPIYVLLFILVGAFFTINNVYNIFPTQFLISNLRIDLILIFKKLSSFFILMAMVAMGLKVNIKSFTSTGLKALYDCSILFLIISILSLILTKIIS
ncbi:YeiH family protein [Senegalia massiliensis]|uniref:YeiH family protein n=1 Tax=Senegalia massiliensis TaxID=1720316 RepID=UPI0010325B8F|nr:putative sulfate exporter family transporter [Senegalia massiliensis]